MTLALYISAAPNAALQTAPSVAGRPAAKALSLEGL